MTPLSVRRNFIRSAAVWGRARLAPNLRAAGKSQNWPQYGGDLEASRYSPLSQITAANVSSLKPAWVHHSAAENSRYRGSVECTPVVVDGVMYIVRAEFIVQPLPPPTRTPPWN